MKWSIKFRISVIVSIFLGAISSALAQQKPQWMPGQIGLNAGILPSPGFGWQWLSLSWLLYHQQPGDIEKDIFHFLPAKKKTR